MSLLDLLQTVGGRLGILEAPSRADAGEPGKVVTRTVTLEELRSRDSLGGGARPRGAAGGAVAAVRKDLRGGGSERSRPRLDASHGSRRSCSRSPFSDQERAAAQLALLNTLQSDHVPAEDLVKEAVAQDQALDAFESFVCSKTRGHMATAERQNRRTGRPDPGPAERTRAAGRAPAGSSRRICAPGDAASAPTSASWPRRSDISPIGR